MKDVKSLASEVTQTNHGYGNTPYPVVEDTFQPNATLRTISWCGELLSTKPVFISSLGANPSEEEINNLPILTDKYGDIQDFGPLRWLEESEEEDEYPEPEEV